MTTTTRIQTKLNLRAEDHLFFDKKNPATGQSLSEEGVQAFQRAPTPFMPDLSKLIQMTPDGADSLHAISEVSQTMTSSQVRLISVMLANVEVLRAHDLNFGDKVYFNVSAPRIEYIDCYVSATVVGATGAAEDDYIILSCDFDKINKKNNVQLTLPRSSMLDATEYKAVRKELRKKGKISAPKKEAKKSLCWIDPNYAKPPRRNEDFEAIPTLDNVSHDWITRGMDDISKPLFDLLPNETKDRKESKKKEKQKSVAGKLPRVKKVQKSSNGFSM